MQGSRTDVNDGLIWIAPSGVRKLAAKANAGQPNVVDEFSKLAPEVQSLVLFRGTRPSPKGRRGAKQAGPELTGNGTPARRGTMEWEGVVVSLESGSARLSRASWGREQAGEGRQGGRDGRWRRRKQQNYRYLVGR